MTLHRCAGGLKKFDLRPSVADPEGPLPGGGVTKSVRSAAGGGCGRGKPPPAGGGPGGLPREIFRKMDANGAF